MADEAVDVLRLVAVVSHALKPAPRRERLVLWMMARFEGIDRRRVARALRVSVPAVGLAQRALVRRGLLDASLALTAAGREAAARASAQMERVALSVLTHLPHGQLDAARSVLTALSLALAGAPGA